MPPKRLPAEDSSPNSMVSCSAAKSRMLRNCKENRYHNKSQSSRGEALRGPGVVQVLPTEAGTLGWAVRRQLPPTLSGSNKTEVTKQYWNLFILEDRNRVRTSSQ